MACLALLTEGWQRESLSQGDKFYRSAIQMYNAGNKDKWIKHP